MFCRKGISTNSSNTYIRMNVSIDATRINYTWFIFTVRLSYRPVTCRNFTVNLTRKSSSIDCIQIRGPDPALAFFILSRRFPPFPPPCKIFYRKMASSSLPALPHVPGTEPSKCVFDSFRTAIAQKVSEALPPLTLEQAYTGVDYGKKGVDFTIALPRFRLPGKVDELASKVISNVSTLWSNENLLKQFLVCRICALDLSRCTYDRPRISISMSHAMLIHFYPSSKQMNT